MAWLRKKSDPLSDRARSLTQEIAALEAQIKTLDVQLQRHQAEPQPRSPSLAQRAPFSPGPRAASLQPAARMRHEPIFEDVDQDRLKARVEPPATPEHFNELGVRKYDLPALWQRIRNQFRGPSTTNPKLVSYLAAGGIQGLRPLRYEKRVARNRLIVLVLLLLGILLGLVGAFVRRH